MKSLRQITQYIISFPTFDGYTSLTVGGGCVLTTLCCVNVILILSFLGTWQHYRVSRVDKCVISGCPLNWETESMSKAGCIFTDWTGLSITTTRLRSAVSVGQSLADHDWVARLTSTRINRVGIYCTHKDYPFGIGRLLSRLTQSVNVHPV